MKGSQKKKYLVVGIEILLGLMYVLGIGRNSNESMFILGTSYFSDLALPFSFYFLLMINENKVAVLQKWWVKAGIVFLMANLAEVGQFFGLYVLGRTFDPMDIIVYAAGVLMASLVDWIFTIVLNSGKQKIWKSRLFSSGKKLYT